MIAQAPDRDIDTLENAAFRAAGIRAELIARRQIKKTLKDVKRELPRGSSTYEGVRA